MSLTLPRVADGDPFPSDAYNEQAEAVEDHEDRLLLIEAKVPQQADIATDQNTTSITFADLATVGPAVTVTLAAGQSALVIVSTSLFNATPGNFCLMSWGVTGVESSGADEVNAARLKTTSSTGDIMLSRESIYVASVSGAHTFTAKYRTNNQSVAAHFHDRRIIAIPL